MISVCCGLAQVRPHLESADGELLKIVLNATSAAEANLAVAVLRPGMPEKDIVAAVNLREVLGEIPGAPFPMALDVTTLAGVAGFRKDRTVWRKSCSDPLGDFDLVVLGDGNLCYDVIVHADGHNRFWSPTPRDEDFVTGETLELIVSRDTLLEQRIRLTKDMGVVYNPKFYLSLEDWLLEYAESSMEDLGGLF